MKSFNRNSVAAASAAPEHSSYRGNKNVHRQQTRYRQNRSDSSFRSNRNDHSRHGQNRSVEKVWTPDGKYGHQDLIGHYFRMNGKGRDAAFKETKEKIANCGVTEYDKGGDLYKYKLSMNRTDTTYVDPAELEGNVTKKQERAFDDEKRQACKCRETLNKNKLAIIMIMEGQSEPALQDHLRDMTKPKTMAKCVDNKDVLGIMDAIEGFVLGTTAEIKVYKPWNQQRTLHSLIDNRMNGPDEFEIHCKQWKACRHALHSVTHDLFPFGDGKTTDVPTAKESADRFYTTSFLSSLNGYFQDTIDKLHRDCRKDPTVFPETVDSAIYMIKDENDIIGQRGAFGTGGVAHRLNTQYSHQQVDVSEYEYGDDISTESDQSEHDNHHSVGRPVSVFHQGEPFYPISGDMGCKPRAKTHKKKKIRVQYSCCLE